MAGAEVRIVSGENLVVLAINKYAAWWRRDKVITELMAAATSVSLTYDFSHARSYLFPCSYYSTELTVHTHEECSIKNLRKG